MSQKKEMPLIGWVIMTALAWLGLAGLSDGVVEWKSWFEQGVMQHWRSVKEWITAVLLWWVPFRVPSWLIDYLVIAMIVVRTSPVPRWKENWRFGPEDAQEKYGYIPFTWKLEWAMSQVFIRWPRLALLFFSWPILFPLMTVEAIRGRAFAPEVNVDPKERRSKVIGWYRRISWSFISFIPVLFVCSTMLYEHG